MRSEIGPLGHSDRSDRSEKVHFLSGEAGAVRGSEFEVQGEAGAVIVMQGEWLRELVFGIGDQIQVECSDGKLTITKAETAAVDPGIGTAA